MMKHKDKTKVAKDGKHDKRELKKMALTKDSKLNISLGLLAALGFYLVTASLYLQDKVNLIDIAIAAGETNKVKWVQHDIEAERGQRLDLRAYLRKNPDDIDAQRDLDVVEDNLDDLNKELDCLREEKENCG